MEGERAMSIANIFDKINVAGGVIMVAAAAVFGEYWFLFAGLLFCNVVDWVSGWQRAAMKGESSSAVGAKGIAKKVWYWVIIGMAFFIGFSFEQMGKTIGVPLGIMNMLGWFVLANYLVNEIRSILENLVDIGVPVPDFMVKGLQITADRLEQAADKAVGEDEDGAEKNTNGG